ncbi:hypothetical protein CEY12_06035 [Chryseobacterium sp. T16E-39]|uniref:hypothetical protein n=1 Tax=Chryseobacterium sp. T16E-39 TaxID=2015076 RepID=UPI000B5B234F|nr:hypothetical protein [Chryseobacterium sp. T16E-39]ASK29690.1 hypothetical protein CEY12_06035 [Chryseobacterium sp. T16E-39]
METLKIEIPKGFEIEKFDTTTGVVSFKEKPKDIKERIKSFSEVLNILEIDEDDFDEENEDLSADEVAYRQIKLIVKALNEGWIPDWTNSKQYKYFPWFNMGSSSGSGFSYGGYGGWNARSAVGSRLCFKSRELAEYAGKQFTEIYKQYMTI